MESENKPIGPTLAIIGASGRQVAEIAFQAGIGSQVVDFFGDRDTRMLCSSQNVSQQDQRLSNTGLPQQLNRRSNVFVLSSEEYHSLDHQMLTAFFQRVEHVLVCGGLENHTEVLSKLESRNKLRCPSRSTITALHDPARINQAMRRLKIPFEPLLTRQELESHTPSCFANMQFLRKDLKSSGGHSVRQVDPSQLDHFRFTDSHTEVFQMKIEGTPISALYCGQRFENGVSARTLGVTRQLVGEQSFGASPFQYCGSLSGIEISNEQKRQVQLIGTTIAKEFGLLGVFGIDFIQNDEAVWLIDINPRFTASSEVVQRSALNATNENLVELHLQAYSSPGDTNIDSTLTVDSGGGSRSPSHRSACFGKAILFNPFDHELVFAESIVDLFSISCTAMNDDHSIADVPMPGTIIKSGHPILTLLAKGANANEVEQLLRDDTRIVYRELART